MAVSKRLASAADLGDSTRALAQRHGAPDERPSLRKDLVARRVIHGGEPVWVVKNPETIKYYYFEDSEWDFIQLFDGTRTRNEIWQEYQGSFPDETIAYSLILDFEEMLRKIELIERGAAERSLVLLSNYKTARKRAAEEKAEGFNPFFIMFHVFDPNRILDRSVRWVRWIWTPPMVALWAVLALFTVGVFVQHWAPIWQGTYELYAFLRKPLVDAIQFFALLCIVGFIHEMGHAYATKIYGGEVRDIGLALLYFTPAFYCDTTDSILFQSKWHRLWVTTAGIYIEGFICAGATFLWVASYPDTLLHELAYKTMLFTGVSTIFFNINPLVKIDGYYALSSILEIPELREEAFRYIGARFQKHVLRLSVEIPVASKRRRRIYWIFGIPALLYIGFIMSFIGGLFHNLYAKYFPNVAGVLLVLTLAFIFKKRVKLTVKTLRLFYLDKRDLLMSKRSRPVLAATALLILLVLFLPWTRRRMWAEGVLRPAETVRIEAPEDGFVTAVAVTEAQDVRKGADLFRLSSAAADSSMARDSAQRERFLKAASAARQEASPEKIRESNALESSATAALASDQMRRTRLDVRSPIDGQVLTPRVQDINGRFVQAGALLAELGDVRTVVADLPVSERRLDDLSLGAPVSAFLPERPGKTVRGKIIRIAPATEGQPVTASGLSDRLVPGQFPDRFVVRVEFENSDRQLRPGALVTAKIYGPRTSPAALSARVLRRWLQTILW